MDDTEPLVLDSNVTEGSLKFMPPGHFCPDVCDLSDFSEADYLRGRVVRAFFRVMEWWPKVRPEDET